MKQICFKHEECFNPNKLEGIAICDAFDAFGVRHYDDVPTCFMNRQKSVEVKLTWWYGGTKDD